MQVNKPPACCIACIAGRAGQGRAQGAGVRMGCARGAGLKSGGEKECRGGGGGRDPGARCALCRQEVLLVLVLLSSSFAGPI